jgi:hypothetical protein
MREAPPDARDVGASISAGRNVMQGMLETLRARAMHGKIEQVSSKRDVGARHVCHLAVDLVSPSASTKTGPSLSDLASAPDN